MPSTPEQHPPPGTDRRQWFVRMSNGSIFGPVHTRGLALWAEEGRIMPDDEVSQDRAQWVPAQSIDELRMDMLIERPDGSLLGPFHEKAIQPLIAEGRIPPNARTLHRDHLPELLAGRQIPLFPVPEDNPEEMPREAPPERASKAVDKGAGRREMRRLQARIDELERALEEARTGLSDAEEVHARECETLRTALGELRTAHERLQQQQPAAGESESEALRAAKAEADAQREALRAAKAEADAQREALRAELREARERAGDIEQRVESPSADGGSRNEESERLAAELDQLREEYRELLAFSNERDAELKARLVAVQQTAQAGEGGRNTAESRRLRQYEGEIVELRSELDTLRAKLAQAEAAALLADRPNEPEIARIQLFGEAALTTLQSVLERQKTAHEQSRAASAASEEALHADIDRLQRALNLAPDEPTRTQQLERRNDLLIAKLRQELEATRRRQQAELNQAAERQRELEQRTAAMEKRERAAREALARAEQRADGHSSMEMQLRRRESALLAVEREFETARQQWQTVESALMRRIEELESGASRLLDDPEAAVSPRRPTTFQATPWMKLHK